MVKIDDFRMHVTGGIIIKYVAILDGIMPEVQSEGLFLRCRLGSSIILLCYIPIGSSIFRYKCMYTWFIKRDRVDFEIRSFDHAHNVEGNINRLCCDQGVI